MNDELIQVRTNIFYVKDKDEKMQKVNELIFLVDKPSYSINNEVEVIRDRTIEQKRICVTENQLELLIIQLLQIKDATEKDLK